MSTLCEMCKHPYEWHLKNKPGHVFVGFVSQPVLDRLARRHPANCGCNQCIYGREAVERAEDY